MNIVELSSDQKLFTSINFHVFVAGIIVCILVGGIGMWTAFARVSGAVVAAGTVVVESDVKKIQHQEGGVVKDILVENGDLVGAGDLLVVLDDTLMQAELKAVTTQLDELYAKSTRLLAEHNDADEIDFSLSSTANSPMMATYSIRANQRDLFHARKKSFIGQKKQLKEQVSQLQQKILGVQAESKAKQDEMFFVNNELDDMKRLLDQKFVAKTKVTLLERDSIQLKGAYSVLLSEIAQDKEIISERHMQILQLEDDIRVEVLQQLQDTRMSVAELEKKKVIIEEQLKRLIIRSPYIGHIHNLSIHTIGGVVSPGEIIMSLVPKKDLLLVEAKVRPVDIEQLSPNQEARLRFPSFDQKKTPEIIAKLKTISADLVQDQVSGSTYYEVMFTIPLVELDKLGGKSLIPGMPVEVFAKTEERTVLSYLLKPIRDQMSYALRER
jgi:HlyD family type I secretion membrane fusion protein